MVRVGLRDPASSEPDDHDPSFEGHAMARAVEYVSAYGVEDHVRTTTLRRPLDDLDEVLLPIVYGNLRAKLLANDDLLRASGCGDHPRPCGFRDLDGRRAHTARARMHEHRLTRLQLRPVAQGYVACLVGDGERGRLLERHGFARRKDARYRHGD